MKRREMNSIAPALDETETLLSFLSRARNCDFQIRKLLESVNAVLFDQLCEELYRELRQQISRSQYRGFSRSDRERKIKACADRVVTWESLEIATQTRIVEWIDAFMTVANRRPLPLSTKWAMLSVPYKCAYPGCNAVEKLEIDHFWPVAAGGSSNLQNLRWLCRYHNAAKGKKLPYPEL
jgi:5-methylcytosine-specific restriction endonuclease McrA